MEIKSVAIVTGASQGIGQATALRLARDFGAVVLVATSKDKLEKTACEVKSLGAEVTVCALDLREPQAAETVVAAALERFGKIDALLNIAGAVPQIDLFEMADPQWDDGMALKFHGARRLTIQAWNMLKASQGSVAFISGSAVLDPNLDLLPSRRLMRPSLHSLRHLPSRESKTGYRSTASYRGSDDRSPAVLL